MKRFAEDTKEYSKEKYWWENIPLVRETVSKPDKDSVNTVPQTSTTIQKVEQSKDEKKQHKKRHHKKERKEKKRKRRRKHSTSSSSNSSSSIEVGIK